jgi:hypothetical protein
MSCTAISLLFVLQLFCQGMTVGEAAEHMGMGSTTLKNIARKFGIKQWPYKCVMVLHAVLRAQTSFNAALLLELTWEPLWGA